MGGLAPPAHLENRTEFARLIDHTLLKATASSADIDKLCDEALAYRFKAVCVNPAYVRQAASRLRGSDTGVCAVVGFPLGANSTETKVSEAGRAIKDGAAELDMAANLGALKGGDDGTFVSEIMDVSSVCRRSNVILKVIIECCYLSDEEKVRAAKMAESGGADFVKTSTGFGPGGATAADVALLRRALGERTKVKAAGGIGTLTKALEMVRAGASRIGTSSGVAIIEELPR